MSFSSYVSIPLVFVSGIWIPSVLLCSNSWFQRQMLYLNNVTLFPGKSLEEPERLEFQKNQIAPFRIQTKDGESLFAWLIAPIGVYEKHAERFEDEKVGLEKNIEQREAFRCLTDDPDSRLLIYFHGNSGTVAQIRRTEEYRMYSSGAPNKIYTLAFDYRGFGSSTGTPSEAGCINDAISVVEWALNVANISPDRIVLLGHSLGTAISTATVHHFLTRADPLEFSGLILCAGFTNATNAFRSYAIGGVVPVLVPLKYMPPLAEWFSQHVTDTWKTDERLVEIVQKSSKLRLALLHANNDLTMPWQQTEELFKRIVEGAVDQRLGDEILQNIVTRSDLGELGWEETWKAGERTVTKLILNEGGHDQMMKSAPVSAKVLQFFGLERQTTS